MKKMNIEAARKINGGAKLYICPWKDYSNTSYWKTYGHAVVCAYNHGLFDIPLAMIKAGIGML